MEKYIIEVDEINVNANNDLLFSYESIIDGRTYRIPFAKLTPYAEPDLEQVKADAYLKGLNDGQGVILASTQNNAFNNGYKKCLKDFERVKKEAYDEGYEKGFVAGYLKAHEQKQDTELNVGDEVITASGKAVVTGVGPVHFEYDNADGSHGFDKVKNVKKTGRHFPEIAAVFEKMREG